MIQIKVFIAYESKYGNGKKCVDYLAGAIKKKGHEVGTFSVREINSDQLPEADLFVFSTPTQIGSPARKMKKFLKKFEVKNKATKYALMITHMNPNATTLQKMEQLLSPIGMTKVSDGVKIQVSGMKGPLESGYKKKLESFANEILSSGK